MVFEPRWFARCCHAQEAHLLAEVQQATTLVELAGEEERGAETAQRLVQMEARAEESAELSEVSAALVKAGEDATNARQVIT